MMKFSLSQFIYRNNYTISHKPSDSSCSSMAFFYSLPKAIVIHMTYEVVEVDVIEVNKSVLLAEVTSLHFLFSTLFSS